MSRIVATCASSIALVSLVAAAAVTADSQPPSDEPVVEISDATSVSLVLVSATVVDDDGRRHDLSRDDFQLAVDGSPVPIEIFERNATAPLSLVVMQDLSGSMASLDKLVASRRAMEIVLSRLRPTDEVAVATFAGGRAEVEVPFTDDLDAVREAIDLWTAYGTTALYDAVAWLPDISLRQERLKRGAILITDGVDNDSGIGPAEARRIVAGAELPVHVLALHIARPPSGGAGGDHSARLLSTLAEATGADYHAIRDMSDVQRATSEVLNALRSQYVLGFRIAAEPAGHRQIEVSLASGDGRIDHRTQYTGGPPLTRGN